MFVLVEYDRSSRICTGPDPGFCRGGPYIGTYPFHIRGPYIGKKGNHQISSQSLNRPDRIKI